MRWSYQDERKRIKCFGDSKPENTKTKERKESTDEENEPRRKLVAGESGKNANILTNIIGNTKKGNLALVETQNGFQGMGIERETVTISWSNLNPHCSSKSHPRWSLPSLHSQHYFPHLCPKTTITKTQLGFTKWRRRTVRINQFQSQNRNKVCRHCGRTTNHFSLLAKTCHDFSIKVKSK